MHIPRNDIVKFFVKETLLHQKVQSQKELADIITKKLSSGDYVVSGRRARQLAMEIPGVRMHIETRKGDKPDESCPVCRNRLRKVYTKNLIGEKLLLSMKCERCGYFGKGDKWVPKKYGFEYDHMF